MVSPPGECVCMCTAVSKQRGEKDIPKQHMYRIARNLCELRENLLCLYICTCPFIHKIISWAVKVSGNLVLTGARTRTHTHTHTHRFAPLPIMRPHLLLGTGNCIVCTPGPLGLGSSSRGLNPLF